MTAALTAPPRRTNRKLNPPRIKLAEYARNIHQITPELGTTLDDILAPEYWAHVGFNLKARDRIEVETEDMTWFAELYVIKAQRLPGTAFTASVRLMRYVDLTGEAELKRLMGVVEEAPAIPLADAGNAEFEIAWKGPAKKFVIIRRSDKVVMRDGIASKVEAQAIIDTDLPAI
jgi:hypothetical protein